MKKNNKKGFLVSLGDFITNYRYILLGIFLVLFVIGLININNVKINESIVSYLPNDTETRIGMDLMEEEFGTLSSIQVMVKLPQEKVSDGYEKISNINNVSYVMTDENSYKDGYALYKVVVIDKSDEELFEIRDKIKESFNEVYMYSDDFDDPTDGVDIVLVLCVIIIAVILLITSKTYFEPIIAFIIFGISIVLNMGSNFLLGEISYITKAIAVILQLALSIDYVIIFMNQYMKEISDTDDKILAIKKTTSKSMPEIFASSLTTVAGLLALVFMQLRIGGDIGIVLSKGIICSLLTVILVMPSLLCMFSKYIIKFKKKEKDKSKALDKLSKFIAKSRNIMLPAYIILIIVSVCLIPNYKYVYNLNSIRSVTRSENIKSLDKIEEVFGSDNMIVLLVNDKNKDYDKQREMINEIASFDKVTSVTGAANYQLVDNVYINTKINYQEAANFMDVGFTLTYNLYQAYASANNELDKLTDINNYRISIIDLVNFLKSNALSLNLDQETLGKLMNAYNTLGGSFSMLESDNYSRIIVNLDEEVESENAYKLVEKIEDTSKKYFDKVNFVSNSINVMDLKSSFTYDNTIITIVTICFIAIILLFTFKSVGATILLILTIEGSIMINFGISSFLGLNIFFMTYIIVSAIQMGATIDYAIVVTSRYLQLRKKYDKKESITGTLRDTLPAVITSGLILLIAGILVGTIATSSVISSIGLTLGTGTLISLIGTIFVLPAILYACDGFIKKTTFKKDK